MSSTFIGYRVFDASRPDGAPHKLLNFAELTRLGWRDKTRCGKESRRCTQIFSPTAASEAELHFKKTSI